MAFHADCAGLEPLRKQVAEARTCARLAENGEQQGEVDVVVSFGDIKE